MALFVNIDRLVVCFTWIFLDDERGFVRKVSNQLYKNYKLWIDMMEIKISWKNPKIKITVYVVCLLLLIVATVENVAFVYQGF